MKKYLYIIGGPIIAGALVFSVIQWNKEVDTTTEKAKEDLTNLAQKDPKDSGELPSANDQDPTTNNQGTEQKDSATVKEPSSNGSNQTDTNTPNNDPVAIEQKQNGQQSGSNPNRAPIPETDSSETAGKSSAEIKSAYQKIFTDLETQETSTLDQLLVQAKADYVSGKYSKSELISKYGSTATQLEKQADQSFNALYSQLQSDLSKNGHDPNEASQFKSEYNSKKHARLSHAISQLEGF